MTSIASPQPASITHKNIVGQIIRAHLARRPSRRIRPPVRMLALVVDPEVLHNRPRMQCQRSHPGIGTHLADGQILRSPVELALVPVAALTHLPYDAAAVAPFGFTSVMRRFC